MFKKWSRSLQLARDVWRRKIGLLLFDRKSDSFEFKPPLKRVVIVRWDAKIGDSIVSSFIFREWRKAYPNIKIDVITTPNMSELFKKYFGADHVYEIKKRPSYGELSKLAIDIGEVDLLVHLSKVLKMKDLYFMNKVKAIHTAGLDDSVNLINLKLGKVTADKHFSEKYKVLLEYTGVGNIDSSYIVPDDSVSQANVDNFLFPFSNSIVAFNPYGSGNSRRLNSQSIDKILDVIITENPSVTVVLLSTPDDKINVSMICKRYDNVTYYKDSQSIYDSIAIMRIANWVISVDTATVHIASGLNKPLLAIYNPDNENYKEWHPNSKLAKNIFSQKSNIQNVNLLNEDVVKNNIVNFLNK